MAKTLTEIQTATRIYAQDQSLVLTSGDGLVSINRLYRQLGAMLPWPELRRQDVTTTTTAGTATYAWPTYPASPRFLDVKAIEIQDADDSNYYKLVYPPPDEWTWNLAAHKQNQNVPDHYMRVSTSSADLIEFRPAPKTSSKTIRITGTIEPDDLEYGADKTFFISQLADDAFEYMVAASWLGRDGFQNESQNMQSKAAGLLRILFEQSEVTHELLKRVVQD